MLEKFVSSRMESKFQYTVLWTRYGGGASASAAPAGKGNATVSMYSSSGPRNSKDGDVSMLTSDLASWGLVSEQPWEGGEGEKGVGSGKL